VGGSCAPVYVHRLHCLVSLDWAAASQQELLSLLITPNLSKITLGQTLSFLRLFIRAMLPKKLVSFLPLFLSLVFCYFFDEHKHKTNNFHQCFRSGTSYTCYKGSRLGHMNNFGLHPAICL